MGAKLGDNNDGEMSEINITPLVDVMLVLLVVFMIASFAVSESVQVNLPEANQVDVSGDEENQVILSIDVEGTLFVGKDIVDIEDAAERIRKDCLTLSSKNTEQDIDLQTCVIIKADEKLPYREVREIMDALTDVGIYQQRLAVKCNGTPEECQAESKGAVN